jgi:hypothetical protein
VGGGTGHLLTTILAHYPESPGILSDLPHLVRDAPALIQSRGLAERITIEAGSFFEAVPSTGDVYLLSHIIHDRSEEQCLAILSNCRRAMNPCGRLLIEMVIPTGDTPHAGKMLDMMLVARAGQNENTARCVEKRV